MTYHPMLDGPAEPIGLAMPKDDEPKPLFIPLKTKFFEAFERGDKNTEYRLEGPRWNAKTCKIGRRVILARGYGKRHRLYGCVESISYDHCPATNIPGWLECYGSLAGTAICIKIRLDPRQAQ